MTEKLIITGSADLLAVVPHLLGAHPTGSFVVLTARAGALGATLRVDAPAEAEPLDYAQMMATYAANDEKATASYVIVYSDETGADGQMHPYAAHVAALANELATARMPVRNVWLVTSTHWTEFGTDEEHPLEAIKDSNANATLTYFGSATDIDLYNPALLDSQAPRVEAPEGTDEDLTAACEDWAARWTARTCRPRTPPAGSRPRSSTSSSGTSCSATPSPPITAAFRTSCSESSPAARTGPASTAPGTISLTVYPAFSFSSFQLPGIGR
jgi:hypothetical protein